MLIADMEKKLERGQVGGVQVERERFRILAYADDLVLLAKNEEGLKDLRKRINICYEAGLRIREKKIQGRL